MGHGGECDAASAALLIMALSPTTKTTTTEATTTAASMGSNLFNIYSKETKLCYVRTYDIVSCVKKKIVIRFLWTILVAALEGGGEGGAHAGISWRVVSACCCRLC